MHVIKMYNINNNNNKSSPVVIVIQNVLKSLLIFFIYIIQYFLCIEQFLTLYTILWYIQSISKLIK